MRNENRNILKNIIRIKRNIEQIKDCIPKEELNDINYCINEIIFRIEYQLEKEEQDYNYLLGEIKNIKILINEEKGGE